MGKDSKNRTEEPAEPFLELEFALTRADLFWYNLHFNRHLLVIALCLALLLFPVIYFLANSTSGDSRLWLFWLLAAILLGIGYCAGSLLIIIAQVYYSSSATIAASLEPRAYRIDRFGLQVRSGDNHWQRTWAEIGEIHITKRAYYLFTPGRGSIIIPRNRLKGDSQRILLSRLLPSRR